MRRELIGALAALLIIAAAGALGWWLGGDRADARWEAREATLREQSQQEAFEDAAAGALAVLEHQDELHAQEEKARATETRLRRELAAMPACPVPAAVVRMLDAATVPAGADGADPGRADEGAAAADSTCARQLAIAERNYSTVCIPNALQLSRLQALLRARGEAE